MGVQPPWNFKIPFLEIFSVAYSNWSANAMEQSPRDRSLQIHACDAQLSFRWDEVTGIPKTLHLDKEDVDRWATQKDMSPVTLPIHQVLSFRRTRVKCSIVPSSLSWQLQRTIWIPLIGCKIEFYSDQKLNSQEWGLLPWSHFLC